MSDHDGRMLLMTEFAVELIGKQGPISFDSGMYTHTVVAVGEDELDGEEEDDFFVIGNPRSRITVDHVKRFLEKLREYMTQPKFTESGRSFFFEGIERTDERSYAIMWGS